MTSDRLKQRWRLVLGRYAEPLGAKLDAHQQGQDEVLQQLYQHGMKERGFKLSGGLEQSPLNIVNWLDNAEQLFPKSVNDILQHHALERFGLDQLLQQPRVLANIEPNIALLKQLMRINAHQDPQLRADIERIIATVSHELLQRLLPIFNRKLSGRLNRQEHSPNKRLANLDWNTTVRKNLKHFDGDTLRFEKIYFYSRQQRNLPWHIILCIDQSGSMAESMIFSAVIAGILARLPRLKLSLVIFDTQVVDLSEHAEDPVRTLLYCQLGGGTHISYAWKYCQQLITEPARTVIATVSDFAEGGPEIEMYQQAQQLLTSSVKMIGMTAINHASEPFYNSQATHELQQLGMDIAALSPDQFADWLANTMGFGYGTMKV